MAKVWEEMTAEDKAEEVDELRLQHSKLVQEVEELKRAVKVLEKKLAANSRRKGG